jgi:hypothetical protein
MKPIIIAALLAGAAGGTVEGVRLDDGRVVTLVPGAMQLFQPGERVLVIPEREGARIEHLLLEP